MTGSISHFSKYLLFLQYVRNFLMASTNFSPPYSCNYHHLFTNREQIQRGIQSNKADLLQSQDLRPHFTVSKLGQVTTSSICLPTSSYPLLVPVSILLFLITCKLTFSLIVVLLHTTHPAWLRHNPLTVLPATCSLSQVLALPSPLTDLSAMKT